MLHFGCNGIVYFMDTSVFVFSCQYETLLRKDFYSRPNERNDFDHSF